MRLLVHPLQTAAWAEFRKAMGIVIEKIPSGYISFHRIPHTPWTIGYMPKGPMITSSMLTDAAAAGKRHNAIYIQFEPNVTNTASKKNPNDKALVPSHHPLFTKYTFVLDLTKSEDELLKAMHPKTRYNIRLAEKHDVKIQEDNSDTAFGKYLQLEKETTERQKFYAHSPLYHKTMWRIMKEAGIAHLFTASFQGETLAAWIIFVHDGVMYYPYGASSRNHREVMAPNLLLWELAKWGKEKKYTAFDLWGAMGPTPDENDPWYGFHRFKTGYNPDYVTFIGSYDLILRPFLYSLYRIADTVRWTLLKLLK